jgi:hypothetical protein
MDKFTRGAVRETWIVSTINALEFVSDRSGEDVTELAEDWIRALVNAVDLLKRGGE